MSKKTISAIVLVICLLVAILILCYIFNAIPEFVALKIRPGMTNEQVTEILGQPDHWATSSYRIAHYTMQDGRTLIVYYLVNNTGEIIVESRSLERT